MVKYCERCRKEVTREGMRFCPHCGNRLVDRVDMRYEENRSYAKSQVPDVYETLYFSKRKMIGYITYKSTETKIELGNKNVNISQTIGKLFRKKTKINENISIFNIQGITIRTKMDFWDTLYAIIFGIFSLFNLVFLLFVAVFLVCAYGKVIMIRKIDGSVVEIPMESSSEDSKN